MSDSLNDRQAYTAGLRQLADLLDERPDIPLPHQGTDTAVPIHWLYFGNGRDFEEQKAIARTIVRAIPGQIVKRETGDLFRFHGRLAGLHLEVVVDRPAVCERVVVGTETVTTTIKDPDAVAALPDVEVTETVEQVEWRCQSILAESEASA